MIITRFTIQNFGKIHDQTFTLSPGINVLYGENESGKTTIHTFIKSMFYGIRRQRGKAAQNDTYSTYEPWNNPAVYGGSLWFESQGQKYRLSRNFYKGNPSCELLNEDTGKLLIGMTGCFLTAWLLLFLPVLLPWSLDTMFFHIVLMGAGHLLRKKEAMKRLEQKPFRVVLCILVFIGSSILSGTGNLSLRSYGSFPPLYLAAALTGSVLAMLFARFLEHYVPKVSALLCLAGAHTMGILCLHLFVFMFFTAGCGILGVSVSHPALQVLMIAGTFVVLTVFELVLDRRKGGPVWRKRK